MSRSRALFASGLVVLVGALVGACGDERDPLTIYSGRSESLVGPLLEQFSEENDVAIDVRYGDTNDLALLIGTEGDRSPADVYWGQSPGATAYLAQRDLLAPLPEGVRGLVADEFEDSQGRWIGTQRPPAGAGLQRGHG